MERELIIKRRDKVAHKIQALNDLHEWNDAQSAKHEDLQAEYEELTHDLYNAA